MNCIRNVFLVSLVLFPSVQNPLHAEISDHILPIASVGLTLLALGFGILFSKKQDNLKKIRKFISNIEYTHAEELEIIRKYDSQRSFFNYGKFNRENQENLRADLVEQALGRTNGSLSYPLHTRIQHVGKTVDSLQLEINQLNKWVKTINKKFDSWSTANEKKTLLLEKELYLATIAKCEYLKKNLQTVRGAIMKSREYKEESYFAQYSRSWFPGRNTPGGHSNPQGQPQASPQR